MCNRFVPSSSNCLWAVVSLSIPYHHAAACGHNRTGYEAAYTALLACVRLLLEVRLLIISASAVIYGALLFLLHSLMPWMI